MPRFALETVDGDTLGTIDLGRPDWPDGSIIWRPKEGNLRVLGHRTQDGDESIEVLVVEET
jgi:hypothetical protein